MVSLTRCRNPPSVSFRSQRALDDTARRAGETPPAVLCVAWTRTQKDARGLVEVALSFCGAAVAASRLGEAGICGDAKFCASKSTGGMPADLFRWLRPRAFRDSVPATTLGAPGLDFETWESTNAHIGFLAFGHPSPPQHWVPQVSILRPRKLPTLAPRCPSWRGSQKAPHQS